MNKLQELGHAALDVLFDRRRRRIAYAVVALALAVSMLFPRPHVGRARILPRDPSTALGAALGGVGSRIQDIGALFGGSGRTIDLYLAVAQSADVRNEVIANLHLAGPGRRYGTLDSASVHLERFVEVQSLPGGILQVEAKTYDEDLALSLTRGFTEVIARHLRSLTSEQVGVKQALLEQRFREAASRLARAQLALNDFRRDNRLSAAPDAELGNAIAVKSGIQARLQAKLVELRTLQQMLGPDNARLHIVETEVEGLRDQLARTTSPAASAGGPNAGGLTELSTQYLDRYRDYLFAQSVYEVYARLSEQVAVEELSDRNAPTLQFIESPHLEPGVHVNVWAMAALELLLLLAAFTELYAPATGIDLWRRAGPDDAR